MLRLGFPVSYGKPTHWDMCSLPRMVLLGRYLSCHVCSHQWVLRHLSSPRSRGEGSRKVHPPGGKRIGKLCSVAFHQVAFRESGSWNTDLYGEILIIVLHPGKCRSKPGMALSKCPTWFRFPFHFRSWGLKIFCPPFSTLASSHWPTVRGPGGTMCLWHWPDVGDCLGLSTQSLYFSGVVGNPGQGHNWQSLCHQGYGCKMSCPRSEPCLQLCMKTQQERLSLVELQRLKPFSLHSEESPSARNGSILPGGRCLSGSYAKTTIWIDTIFMNDKCSHTAALNYTLYQRSDCSQDPKRKVFSKYKLDKVPACFCHPNAHNCRCVSLKQGLINPSSGATLGT